MPLARILNMPDRSRTPCVIHANHTESTDTSMKSKDADKAAKAYSKAEEEMRIASKRLHFLLTAN